MIYVLKQKEAKIEIDVYNKLPIRKDLKAHTEKILERLSDALSMSYTVIEQPPTEAIIAEAENNAHDMIVIGTHGLSGRQRRYDYHRCDSQTFHGNQLS